GRLQRTGSRPLPLAPAARDPGAGRRGGPLPLPSRRRAARRDPRGGRPPPRRAGPATRRGAGAGCGAGASPPRRCALRGATPPLLALFPPALRSGLGGWIGRLARPPPGRPPPPRPPFGLAAQASTAPAHAALRRGDPGLA